MMRVQLAALALLMAVVPAAAADETPDATSQTKTAAGGGQAAASSSLADTAKQLNNPIGGVWNVVLQNNLTLLKGDISSESQVRWVTNFQPVMPVPVTEDWNLITRPIIPFVSAPIPQASGGFDREGGVGDITLQLFASPSASQGFVWGLGPVFQFPSASSDALGSEKWSAGPSLVVLNVGKRWVVGGLLTHVQSFAGNGARDTVSVSSLQYFATLLLPNQWQVGLGTPVISVNWEASEGNQWTVPIGLSVGKTVKLGTMPFQMSFETTYAVVHPEFFGERWNFRLILKPVVPALIRKPIFGS